MRLRRMPEAKDIISSSPLVLTEKERYPGSWREYLSIPPGGVLNLEIGMGRGKFITEACFKYPDQAWIGLEIREEMIMMSLNRLCGKIPENLRFLWLDAALLSEIFSPGEIDNIFLPFSDPWPKARHAKRRLTHDNFLKIYDNILSPNGKIIYKTDNRDFFFWSKEKFLLNDWHIITESQDLPLLTEDIISEYEARYRRQGMPIYQLILKK